jgi:RNA-directed DNA polymerase
MMFKSGSEGRTARRRAVLTRLISPLLLNVALHGLEEAAGVQYYTTGAHAGKTVLGCPTVVRYADDLVACCHSRQQAQRVQARLAKWLAPRGLTFNEDKTTIVHLEDGFDFLGFNVRRYRGKLLIKPSKAAVKQLRARLTSETRSLRGSNAMAVIARLNPIIRGWAAYYRGVVASETFGSLDYHLWKLTYKWAKFTHPNKSKHWICDRYFGKFNKFRNDHWVFGARDRADDRGTPHLTRFSWTDIVRHQAVRGTASPDDPDLAQYWAIRRRRIKPPLDNYTIRLLDQQRGRCPLCGDHLLVADQPPQSPHEWERWWLAVTRKAITRDHLVHDGRADRHGKPDRGDITRLVHATCRRSAPRGPRHKAQQIKPARP